MSAPKTSARGRRPASPQRGPEAPPPARIRLAKLLAQRGIAARRKAEEIIAEGRVTVNGEVAATVTLVDPERDVVRLDGKPLPPVQHKAYYLLYKPAGYLSSRGGLRGRHSVFDLCAGLPVRVETVGRLDYDTEGALLLTNDGHLAHALTHPSTGVPKRYVARVEGVPDRADIRALETGVPLTDGVSAPARARVLEVDRHGNARVELTVTEGRNRLVRRMLLAVGHPVRELRRESFAGITLRGMKPGELRPLTEAEVRRLQALVDPGRARRRPAPGSNASADRPPKTPRKRKQAGG